MSQFIENLKKDPLLLAGVVIFAVCLIFGLFRTNQLTKLSATEADLNTKLDKIGLNKKYSEKIDQDIQSLKELVDTVDERLFVGEERSMNIDSFYSFEEKLDIVISEVKQLERNRARFAKEGPDELKLYSVVDYDVTVNGSFHEILRFVYEIYRADSIMRVSDFEIDATTRISDRTDKLWAKIRVAVLATK